MPFYSTKEFSLYKTSNQTYMIKFIESNEKLTNSLINTNFLPDTTLSTDNKTIIIRATSITTIADYKKTNKKEKNTSKLSYDDGLRSLYSLTKQIEYLMKYESSCFYTYEPENVIIINNNIYLYLSSNHLVEFKNKKIRLNCIFEKNSYLSPEIKNIKSIPSEVNHKTIYYSLGMLIIHILFDSDENIDNESDIQKRMKPIEGTKLYYYLLRCMAEDVEQRVLLFI